MDFHHIIIPLLAGFILDAIIGDPHWMPHPIRLFGSVIAWFERHFNTGNHQKLKGLFTVLLLTSAVCSLFYFGIQAIYDIDALYYPVASIFVFFGLANRNLMDEAWKVEHALTKKGIEAGRKQLSFIVGRETAHLPENKIRIAVLETLSENLNDGVIAPLFFYAIGGVPLMMTYKMVNTMDSMIGYKSDRYKDFGLVAAKLDDVFNYIPARITALLMIIVSLKPKAFITVIRFGHKHASPNSGYPESALAGILNCRFGGPNTYHGKLVEKPYIGENDHQILTSDIRKACIINGLATLLAVFIIVLLA